MSNWIRSLAIGCVVATAANAWGASATYLVSLNGANEVAPAIGDPDGAAAGIITLDDVTGNISYAITYANLETLSDFHIHGPNGPAGVSQPVWIGFGVATTVPGTLTRALTLPVADLPKITQVLANPANFYLNIHTTPTHGAGAVRGQLGTLVPEPSTVALFAVALIGLPALRRRRARHANP
jgi:hypothetical protein